MTVAGSTSLDRPRDRAMTRALPAVRFAGILVIASLAAAVVADRISIGGGAWLWQLDLPKIDFPLASFFHDALAAGRLPLWNDNLGLGFPLYAEGQIGAFYPPNWLLYQLPPLNALDAVRVLHLVLAGVGTGLIGLRLSGSRTGALLATVVAVLGGAITTKLEWTNVVEAYGLLPWVLLPLIRRPFPTRRGLVLAGIAWGIQALAGHPNVWLLTGIAAVVVLLVRRPSRNGLAATIGFGLLGGCVGAIQLLPTLVLTGLSVRSAGVSANDLFASAATVFDPLTLGFANAFVTPGGSAWDIHSVWYPDTLFPLLEANTYVTLTVVALAAVGARTRRARPLLAVCAVMVAIPVIAAFRPAVWLDMPILNGLRSPVRSYVVLSVMLGVLAAIGVGRLGRQHRGVGLAVTTVVGLIVAYLGCLAAAIALPGPFETVMTAFSIDMPADIAAQRRDLAVQALSRPFPFVVEAGLGLGAVAIIVWLVRAPKPSRLRRVAWGAVLVVAAALPLALLSPQANPTSPAADFTNAGTPFVRMLQGANAHRLLTLGEPGWYEGMPDQLAMAGVPDLNMFSSLNLLASDRLLASVRDDPEADALRRAVGVDVVVTFDQAPCPGAPVAMLDQPRSAVCRLDALRPPYWLPADTATAVPGSTGSALQPAEATVDARRVISGAREAQVSAWDAAGDRFTIDAPAAGWIWIDRAWWPGWRTEVDGQAATALRAMGGQLVRIGAGRHVLTQSLVPWDALLGAGLALVALAAAGLWLRVSAARDRRAGEAPVPGVR